jgi:hypothetical protein
MLALLLNKTEALLDVPILIQDGIIVALFAGAAGFLLYKKLRKKTKSCPACAGDCAADPKPLRISGK